MTAFGDYKTTFAYRQGMLKPGASEWILQLLSSSTSLEFRPTNLFTISGTMPLRSMYVPSSTLAVETKCSNMPKATHWLCSAAFVQLRAHHASSYSQSFGRFGLTLHPRQQECKFVWSSSPWLGLSKALYVVVRIRHLSRVSD